MALEFNLNLTDFKRDIRHEFGPNLEHATPANVREFLDRMQARDIPSGPRAPLELNETKTTYEEILRDFFARVLDFPRDEALILLWTLSFELSFAMIEHDMAERFGSFFKDFES